MKKVILTNNSVSREDTSIHYLCKKLDNNGKIITIVNLFKNVNLLKNKKLEIVGNIPEGDVFVHDNTYLKDEFGVEINKKKNTENIIINNNIENEENKYIN